MSPQQVKNQQNTTYTIDGNKKPGKIYKKLDRFLIQESIYGQIKDIVSYAPLTYEQKEDLLEKTVDWTESDHHSVVLTIKTTAIF